MREVKVIKKPNIALAALAFVFALLCMCSGCKAKPASGVQPLKVTGEITEYRTQVKDESLHLIDAERLVSPMASSGLMQLYLDDNSLGVALYETSKEKFWYSLPLEANDAYDSSAAVVTLTIGCKNSLYYVNSQDNSVAYSNAMCDILGDEKLTGFVAKYVITVDDAVAQKVDIERVADGLMTQDDFLSTDIVFEVDVTYELRDGNLYISAQWKNLSGNKDAYIEKMGLFEFFGASDEAQQDDFILVPDGCGAVIRTAQPDEAFEPLKLKLYGDDAAVQDNNSYSAVFPAFGARQGSDAFVIIIESGDAVANINADRATGSSGFNTVGASFDITATRTVTQNGVQTKYISATGYTGEIRLCVRLLGGGSASFDGMAAACREQFMRNGIIPVSTVQSEDYLPFNLSVICASTGVSRLSDKIEKVNVFTTFEQTQDLLSRMKAKGINNINARLIGALDGGVNQNTIGQLSVLSGLGGKSGFEKLASYTGAQGDGLFLDVSVLSWNSDKLISLRTARNIAGEAASAKKTNVLSTFSGPESFSRFLVGYERVEDVVIGILTGANKLGVQGICVNDAGAMLYSDWSSGFTDRQSAAGIIAENLAPLSTSRELMVDTGNFYSIKKADVIANLPLSPSAAQREGKYDSVPFVQMILHGTVSYSGSPVNLEENPQKAALRYIEYGACPCYEWCYESEETNSGVFLYDNSLSEAAELYAQANDALNDLASLRITDNFLTEISGVYCTEYENGAMIYVNYNDASAQVNGITVEAQSFIKID